MPSSKKKGRLTAEQRKLNQIRAAFKRKIRSVFVGAGFAHIPTNDHEMYVGLRKVEVDALFVYENIWLLCEDTVKTTDIRDHIRTKNEAFGEIKQHLSDYIEKLVVLFPDRAEFLKRYEVDRLKVFGLYVSREDLDLSSDDLKRFENLTFVQPQTINYFHWIVQCIKLSARNEIFRFLGVRNNQIGFVCSANNSTQITAPIIYPKEFTGLKNKVRIVSFMMSAGDLLDMCYVLRKDNWDESIWLYQRLIDKKKIKNIRAFIESKGEAFYNNIIVALPDNISFVDSAHHYQSIECINGLESDCKLVLPKEMNSICVIDGQHRIYAHYESGLNTKQEQKISTLRKQLHLLVTGLAFPPDMTEEERVRLQSEIFVDINSNAKPVPQNVLLHIKRIINPIADESIAQFVIEKLNKEGVFKGMLQLSPLDNAKLKTASIVRFALRYLVTIKPADGKSSLFQFWNGDHDALLKMKGNAVSDYVQFCASTLRNYFGAVKKSLKSSWEAENSKILSVISINGFIIALTRQLFINGVQDFDYYTKVFNGWKYDFSNEGFSFTSSQYRKFSRQILIEAFRIPEATVDNI